MSTTKSLQKYSKLIPIKTLYTAHITIIVISNLHVLSNFHWLNAAIKKAGVKIANKTTLIH